MAFWSSWDSISGHIDPARKVDGFLPTEVPRSRDQPPCPRALLESAGRCGCHLDVETWSPWSWRRRWRSRGESSLGVPSRDGWESICVPRKKGPAEREDGDGFILEVEMRCQSVTWGSTGFLPDSFEDAVEVQTRSGRRPITSTVTGETRSSLSPSVVDGDQQSV